MRRFKGNPAKVMAWNAFMAFIPGAWMVYAGAEAAAQHTPSLFDFEPIDWARGLSVRR
jgi:alpha-amylase